MKKSERQQLSANASTISFQRKSSIEQLQPKNCSSTKKIDSNHLTESTTATATPKIPTIPRIMKKSSATQSEPLDKIIQQKFEELFKKQSDITQKPEEKWNQMNTQISLLREENIRINNQRLQREQEIEQLRNFMLNLKEESVQIKEQIQKYESQSALQLPKTQLFIPSSESSNKNLLKLPQSSPNLDTPKTTEFHLNDQFQQSKPNQKTLTIPLQSNTSILSKQLQKNTSSASNEPQSLVSNIHSNREQKGQSTSVSERPMEQLKKNIAKININQQQQMKEPYQSDIVLNNQQEVLLEQTNLLKCISEEKKQSKTEQKSIQSEVKSTSFIVEKKTPSDKSSLFQDYIKEEGSIKEMDIPFSPIDQIDNLNQTQNSQKIVSENQSFENKKLKPNQIELPKKEISNSKGCTL